MLNTQLKTALKGIKSNKIFSFVNISGLTIGLAACMIVATVVINDLSYDRQWSKSADLYRILTLIHAGKAGSGIMPYGFSGLGPALKKNFPDVVSCAAISRYPQSFQMDDNPSNLVSLEALVAD